MNPRILLAASMLGMLSVGVAAPEGESAAGTGVVEQPSVESAVLGRTWQLVSIASMDDREFIPDDASVYTLRMEADGIARLQADCNRAMGAWESSRPGKLQFGLLATTKALCPPGSLSDRYLEQFQGVRSYVTKNGHLFLATLADGSIIEFEPLGVPMVATVLGEEIRTLDFGEMQQTLLSRLFDRYTEQQEIAVSDAEVEAFVEQTRRGMRVAGLTAADELTPEEAAQADQMQRDMARSMIRQWKLNRALYRQYGGRLIRQQLGPEPEKSRNVPASQE